MASIIGFSGTVYHQLDEKGRVRIPSKFIAKEEGESEDKSLVMKLYFVAGSKNFISVYMQEAFQEKLNELKAIPNTTQDIADQKRKIFSSIESVETDKQGRTVIPTMLRNYAKINKELVSVGVGDHFEIWAKEEYENDTLGTSFAKAQEQLHFFL